MATHAPSIGMDLNRSPPAHRRRFGGRLGMRPYCVCVTRRTTSADIAGCDSFLGCAFIGFLPADSRAPRVVVRRREPGNHEPERTHAMKLRNFFSVVPRVVQAGAKILIGCAVLTGLIAGYF